MKLTLKSGVVSAVRAAVWTALASCVLSACGGKIAEDGPSGADDPRTGHTALAIFSPTQSTLTVSGIFRQAKWGKNVLTAVLVPDTTFFAANTGTIATMAANGYALMDVDIDTSTGQRLYSAVFESSVPSTQYWELSPTDFESKVTALAGAGLHIVSLHTYVSTGGTLLYSGVFQPGPDAQLFPGSMPWSTFTSTIDSNAASGYYLTNLAVYVSAGQEQFLGVWRYHPESTMRSAFWVSEWNSFAKEDELQNASGMRLVTMAHWEFNGDRKYGGVWLEGNDTYGVVAATDAAVYQRKVGELASAGNVPIRIMIEHGYEPPIGLASAFNDEFDPEVVGYGYAISEKGALTAKGAFGYARAPWEPSSNFPNGPMEYATRMDVASVTKAVASTSIFKLLEGSTRTCTSGSCNASNFSLNTPIGSVLTAYTFGQYVNQVTVGMLVDMTSNLYEGACDTVDSTNLTGYLACVLGTCTRAYPQATSGCAPPSGQYNYNGADPTVLRAIIETLSGKTFEQYANDALFVPAGINNGSLAATDLSNANCNPSLTPSVTQPLYYATGSNNTHATGLMEVNNRARSLKVCGAGAMQAGVWQLDLFARGLMTGINGAAPFLTTTDRNTMLTAGMFGGPAAYPSMGQVFAKNGGFDMSSANQGMASAIVMARDINTQVSAIVNTQGTDLSTNVAINMPNPLVDGLVRMTSTPMALVSVRSRNNATFGDMCLNVSGGALADSTPDGGLVNVIQWTCGSPVANNMLFVQRDAGNGFFVLQSLSSGQCLNVAFGSNADGENIIQYACAGTSNELFSFVPTVSGYGHIVSQSSGKCIEVSGGSVFSGAAIVQDTCSTSEEQDFELQSNAPIDSGSPFGVPLLFWPADNGVNPSDWAPGSAKGQCASGQTVMGLSQALNQSHSDSILCETYPGSTGLFPQTSCHTLMFSAGVNPPANAPASWPNNASYPDWDPGYYKAQCAPNEYVAGVSQNLNGQVDGILCCAGGVAASSCENSTNAEVFYNSDSHSRQTAGGLDWDPGYYKGQCPGGWYVQGVSAVLSGTSQVAGAAHAVRCCSP